MTEHDSWADATLDPYRVADGVLDALGLPATFALDDLHRRIERLRGRPVHLIARDLPALAPHGLWVAGEHADYVFYDGSAAPVRQHQIIGHELGHLLLDPEGPPESPDGLAALFLPGVVPAGSLRTRGRSSYEAPAERRAEVFGTVAVQRLHSWRRPLVLPPEPIARLYGALQRGGG